MKIGKTLHGARVCIRDYEKNDLAFSTAMWFDQENGRYMSDPTAEHVDARYQQALDGLQDSEDGYYLMVEVDGKPVGTCCAFPDDQRKTYDIGYCIHKSHWRQGYGTETVALLAEWIRQQGGRHMTAEVAVENAGSNALLRKLGFSPVREAEFGKYNMDIRYKSYIYQLNLD